MPPKFAPCDFCARRPGTVAFSKQSTYRLCEKCAVRFSDHPAKVVCKRIDESRCEFCGQAAYAVVARSGRVSIRLCAGCRDEDDGLERLFSAPA